MGVGPVGISVIGNVNVDVIVSSAPRLPPPGTESIVDDIAIRTGGAAGNAALTLAHLGSPAALVGCVGDDGSAKLIHEETRRAGVTCFLTTVPDLPTGVCVAIQSPDRDRSFLTSLGGLSSFDVSMVPADALDAGFTLICGYFLLPRLRGESAHSLLSTFRERRRTTLLDTGWDPAGWPEQSRREVLELLPLVDIFLPNEAEATALTGEEDVLCAARVLQDVSGGAVVVKQGSSGCSAITPEGEALRAAAPVVEATDTTGAGDAFNAGLVCALSRGSDWSEALSFATRVASTVVSRTSDRRYPTPGELLPPG